MILREILSLTFKLSTNTPEYNYGKMEVESGIGYNRRDKTSTKG